MSDKQTKIKKDCPIGDKKLQNIVILANLIGFTIIATIVYLALDYKAKQILPLVVGSLGAVLFFTGIILSLFYTILGYKKPQGGFGIFGLLGIFFIVFGTLITFMEKVG